ncbi:MAG: hypothetical protein ACOC3Z_03340, partial [Nanoarchaeota archaeon]
LYFIVFISVSVLIYFYLKFKKIKSYLNSRSYKQEQYKSIAELRKSYQPILLEMCEMSYKITYHEYIIFLVNDKRNLSEKDHKNSFEKMLLNFQKIAGNNMMKILSEVYGNQEVLFSNIRVIFYNWYLADKIIKKFEDFEEMSGLTI